MSEGTFTHGAPPDKKHSQRHSYRFQRVTIELIYLVLQKYFISLYLIVQIILISFDGLIM